MLCGARAPHAVACVECAKSLPRTAATCPRCALPMSVGELCGRCLRHPPAFDAALAAFEYRFPVDRLVKRFKFSGDLATGRWLAMQLARRVREVPLPALLVVPALTRARLRRRGFNQALEIARHLGRPIAPRGVLRVKHTPPQTELPYEERAKNVRGAFLCKLDLSGARVAVLDDVMTTGATLNELARVLKRAGATRVENFVIARTVPR